jgi:ubiquitin-like 1-activating enzyme E1 B
VEECVEDVLGCLMACYCDMGGRAQHVGALEFDKDDAVAMRFVSACTNLRQRVFSIAPLQPLHECKGIAGNIIPAIATTNAMAAGLQVLEALKLLDSGLDKSLEAAQCKTTYISRGLAGRKKLLLQPTSLLAPSPKCFVCNKAGADLVIDTTKATFGMLMNDIIMTRLVVSLPQLMKGDAEIVYDGENPQGAASRMDKTLAQLGMIDQTRLELDDLDVRLRHTTSIPHQTIRHWGLFRRPN